MSTAEQSQPVELRTAPFEVDLYIPRENVDAALAALRAAGPTGFGSLMHDRVAEELRGLVWWIEEWGWSSEWRGAGVAIHGAYGDFTHADDDVRFFGILAPFVDSHSRCKGVVADNPDRHVDFYRDQVFEWRFDGGVAKRWKLDRQVIYLETGEEL